MLRQSLSESTRTDDATVTLDHARSAILRHLTDRDEPAENLELVTADAKKAEIERGDADAVDLSFQAVHDQVTTTHLPALADDGLVEYDRVNGRVALAVSPDENDSPPASPDRKR